MKENDRAFPERDEALGRLLAEAAPLRVRTEADWTALRSRIVASAELSLARRRAAWWSPVAEHARAFATAAAVALVVLGGIVYMTPRADASFAEISAELMELLGEEELRTFFPGVDDPDSLLEAALAAQ
jgi:hypothetical protein